MAADFPDDLDGQVLQMLAEDGNDLSRPMPVEFVVAAGSEENADAIADECEKLGFETHVYLDTEPPAEHEEPSELPWKCVCAKDMIPVHAILQEIQSSMARIAKPFGGEVEGWGTFGNAPAQN